MKAWILMMSFIYGTKKKSLWSCVHQKQSKSEPAGPQYPGTYMVSEILQTVSVALSGLMHPRQGLKLWGKDPGNYKCPSSQHTHYLHPQSREHIWAAIPLQLHLYGSAGTSNDLGTPSSACILSTETETVKYYSQHIISQRSQEVKKISLSTLSKYN